MTKAIPAAAQVGSDRDDRSVANAIVSAEPAGRSVPVGLRTIRVSPNGGEREEVTFPRADYQVSLACRHTMR